MTYDGRYSFRAAAAALAVLAIGCSGDKTNLSGTGQATVSLSRVSSSTAASFSITSNDSVPPGFIPPSSVDSLVVTVTSVQVLPESLLARRHPGEDWGARGDTGPGLPPGPGGPGGGMREGHGPGPFGPHGRRDSLMARDSTMLRDSLGWGRLPEDWYTLDVVGSGHLDLMHLPTDSAASGLALAVGTVPVGAYAGARLVVSSITIYLNASITAGGRTFLPNTGYTVTMPQGPDAGIRTQAGFTIAEGATEVQLVFDPNAAVRGAFVAPTGDIVIAPPPMGHREHRP